MFPSLSGSWVATVGTVAAKEIRELLRDIRSVTITVIVPILLFPALFLLFSANIDRQDEIGDTRALLAIDPTFDTGELPPIIDRFQQISGGVDEVVAGTAAAALAPPNRIVYDSRSEVSTTLAGAVHRTLSDASTSPASSNEDPAGQPSFVLEPLPAGDAATAAPLSIAAIIPLFLLLAGAVSALPAALDLGAGEKQRQSLEFLLSTTTRRSAVFLGKAAAATVTGYLGTASFVVGIVLSDALAPELLGLADTSLRWGTVQIATLVVTVVAVVAVVAVAELVLSFLARSPREAQGYFLPLLVACSGIGYTAMSTDVFYLSPWMLHVPVLNAVLLVKMIALDAAIFPAFWWVIGENLGILALFSTLGGIVLRTEWVLHRS
ncbi:MAG: ABC transporter permease subunit [Alkalispirochaeta sp.]